MAFVNKLLVVLDEEPETDVKPLAFSRYLHGVHYLDMEPCTLVLLVLIDSDVIGAEGIEREEVLSVWGSIGRISLDAVEAVVGKRNGSEVIIEDGAEEVVVIADYLAEVLPFVLLTERERKVNAYFVISALRHQPDIEEEAGAEPGESVIEFPDIEVQLHFRNLLACLGGGRLEGDGDTFHRRAFQVTVSNGIQN